MQGVYLLLKKGQLNGTECKDCGDGVSAAGSCARLTLIHPQEEPESSRPAGLPVKNVHLKQLETSEFKNKSTALFLIKRDEIQSVGIRQSGHQRSLRMMSNGDADGNKEKSILQ